MASVAGTAPYPVRFDVDYPESPRNRLTVAFRLLLVIPIALLLLLLSGGPAPTSSTRTIGPEGRIHTSQSRAAGAVSLVVLPTVAMLVVRRRYPRWWFEWNREFSRFSYRVAAYTTLLRDEYPSTEDEQAVHLEIDYPDTQQLNRWLPLVKWLLAIPHYIVLILLGLAMIVVTVIAWFAILISGRYPRGLFDFAVGVSRWGARVSGYAFLLVTDRYPPFSLH